MKEDNNGLKENLDRIMEHKGLLLFAGGAITAIVAKKVIESDTAKKLAVKTVAKVMQVQDEAKEALLNIKEDAEDIRHDAIEENKETVQNS
ncbi:MAG: DUF6110 family protein [Methanobrevibacter sp.]|nr:DUF6110 family protein [Methanobrevibacter sp.]